MNSLKDHRGNPFLKTWSRKYPLNFIRFKDFEILKASKLGAKKLLVRGDRNRLIKDHHLQLLGQARTMAFVLTSRKLSQYSSKLH